MNPPMMILISPKYRKIEIKLTNEEFEKIVVNLGDNPDEFIKEFVGR